MIKNSITIVSRKHGEEFTDEQIIGIYKWFNYNLGTNDQIVAGKHQVLINTEREAIERNKKRLLGVWDNYFSLFNLLVKIREVDECQVCHKKRHIIEQEFMIDLLRNTRKKLEKIEEYSRSEEIADSIDVDMSYNDVLQKFLYSELGKYPDAIWNELKMLSENINKIKNQLEK